ncbi:Wadjet anti-phage system protein JetD domain-containing protein [Streptomyces sp. NPDC005302]|uniref:Wadjet anti-phage system protein JetD domain-containing protein n=1 Tax=Streptomyces sp. NPDC005302 TaxID=3154675 RepID=UPI0033B5AE6F
MTTPHNPGPPPARPAPLPVGLAEWASTPGGALFLRTARKHIYRGGKLQRPLPLTMTARERGDLIELFGSDALTPGRLNPAKAEAALLASRYHMTLRALLISAGGPLRTGKGRARYQRLIQRDEAHTARHSLLTAIHTVSPLDEERALLRALPADRKRVPNQSRTHTTSWSVYEAALRAAAVWWQGQDRGWTFAERELSVRALGGSKRWTPATQEAFCRLIGKRFDEAVRTTDTAVRIQGPGDWQLDSLVANFDHDIPFLEIPGRTAAEQGRFTHTATGILLIENQETFEAIRHHTDIPETWLRIWLEGFVSDALVDVVSALPDLPLAIWTDLDPPGIDIVTNLAQRLNRPLHPVAMDPTTYSHGFYLDEPADKLAKWQRHAVAQARTGPVSLRPLAAAIAANDGRRCEQEGLHEDVMPRLGAMLANIAAPRRSGSAAPVPAAGL